MIAHSSGDGVSVFNEYYDPEHVTSFEIGSKNLLADRKFRANASAFMSVTNQPGANALTWMEWRAHSAASARVNPITPLLDAA